MGVADELREFGLLCNSNQYNEQGAGLQVAPFDNKDAFVLAVKRAFQANKVLVAEYQSITPLLFPGVTPGRPRNAYNVLLDTGLELRYVEVL